MIGSRRVENLIIIGANPAYDAPGDLGLGDAIAAVPVYSASRTLSG